MTPEELSRIEEVIERYDFSPEDVIRLLESLGREISAEMNLIINGVPGQIEPIGLSTSIRYMEGEER